jgi:hypothetical protein
MPISREIASSRQSAPPREMTSPPGMAGSACSAGVDGPSRAVGCAAGAFHGEDTVVLFYGTESESGAGSKSGAEAKSGAKAELGAGGEELISSAGGGCVDETNDWTSLAIICAAEAETAEAEAGGEAQAGVGGRESEPGGSRARTDLAEASEATGVAGEGEESTAAGDRASKRKR